MTTFILNNQHSERSIQVLNVDDFEKLTPEDKNLFKEKHPLSYAQLFSSTPIPEKFDWRNHTKELNFYPSDIKSPDDFESLSENAKLYFKQEFPQRYREVFTRDF